MIFSRGVNTRYMLWQEVKRSPCVRENDISGFNFVSRSLLNHLVGNNNSIPNIIVDLNEESILCLCSIKG